MVKHSALILVEQEVGKGEVPMYPKPYPVPDCGFDDLVPDAYDAEGHRTINSWELFKQDELASEDDD